MATDLSTVTVEDIAAPIRNAIVGGPFGSNLVSRDYVESGVPVIRGQNMGARWVSGDFAYVSHEKAKSLEANLARPGDIVFTQRGTLGQVSIVPDEPIDFYLVSQSQMKLTVNSTIADKLFIYYIFTSSAQQDYIQQNAIQTGVPHTNLGILRSTPLTLPPLPEQRAIAHILGTLDDKIELNRRMNETLEAMARALFHDWFVAFGPTRAKMAGQEPYLPKRLWDLFPDALNDAGIPEGWKTKALGDVTSKIGSGATPRGGKTVYVDSGVALIRSQNVYDANFAWDGLAYIDSNAADSLRNVVVQDLDVLFNITGASILRTCLAPIEALPARVNQHVCIIRAGLETCPYFLHLWMLLDRTKEYLIGLNAGGSREAITKGHLEGTPILQASSSIHEHFSAVVTPWFKRIAANNSEVITLTALRDTLLPKLISGELRVPDVERILERAS
ncbi:MAG: restriction endonuclease subunit S [Spiribacter salinus]|uniref:Restriction endonuclease subunit S n=1 Tax=Spiribacter salinus TaxID=1335746 RepID=A0A540VR40_9GAMM|nr:MAG: restriction endonuclease subunit S [Spiribacter salinus]